MRSNVLSFIGIESVRAMLITRYLIDALIGREKRGDDDHVGRVRILDILIPAPACVLCA